MSTPSSPPPTPTIPPQNTTPILIVLLLVDSLHFVFARSLLPLISPGVSAMYVLVIATIIVGAYGLVRGELSWRPAVEHGGFLAAIGLLIAGSTNINYEAVAFIDPGTAALLGKAGVVFGLALSFLWLHEKLTAPQILGSAVAVLGVMVISYQPGDYFQLGSLLVLTSTFMYAIHAAIVKRYAAPITFVNFFFYRLLFASLFLLLFSTLRGALALPTPVALALLILTAAVDVVLSRALYYIALRRMQMSIHTIVLTASPVVAVVWSLLFFDVIPTPQEMLGGLGVLVGVLIVTVRRRK
ncbi:MAG: DMT family transporter [Caldilineaceae bacterium]|nr:DMT family transporter [Caldilineaceae bacterium]MBP9073173.1 DMT family transporter [Caldilineaceae bacterium]